VKSDSSYSFRFNEMARPERLELSAFWFEARCSIQLSYGRAEKQYNIQAFTAN
jgi:hypothetical protein